MSGRATREYIEKIKKLQDFLMNNTDAAHVATIHDIEEAMKPFEYKDKRSLYRLIKALDVQVYYDPAQHGYYTNYRKIDRSELEKIRQSLENNPELSHEEVENIFSKVEEARYYRYSEARNEYYGDEWQQDEDRTILLLKKAISENRKIRLTVEEYQLEQMRSWNEKGERMYAIGVGGRKTITVIPYCIRDDWAWRFIAKDSLGSSLYFFREQIIKVQLTNKRDNYQRYLIIQLKVHESQVKLLLSSRYAPDIRFSKCDEHHFVAEIDSEPNQEFFGWILSFGDKIEILSPPEVREAYQKMVLKSAKRYK